MAELFETELTVTSGVAASRVGADIDASTREPVDFAIDIAPESAT